ncbi:MAG: RNA polymerase sigma factor [Planctomycetota bacterium]
MAGEAEKGQTTDWLSRLFAGDHEAFGEFIDKYKGTVFMCCRTLGLREDDVEDVASETFMAAYRSIRRYRGQAELGTWLWKIAYHKAVSHLRKYGRVGQLCDEDVKRLSDIRRRPSLNVLEDKEEAESVWRLVMRLPKMWAVAILLFYREEKNVSEIAKIMKKRENTVKTFLFRGRKKLKELLATGQDFDARK